MQPVPNDLWSVMAKIPGLVLTQSHNGTEVSADSTAVSFLISYRQTIMSCSLGAFVEDAIVFHISEFRRASPRYMGNKAQVPSLQVIELSGSGPSRLLSASHRFSARCSGGASVTRVSSTGCTSPLASLPGGPGRALLFV